MEELYILFMKELLYVSFIYTRLIYVGQSLLEMESSGSYEFQHSLQHNYFAILLHYLHLKHAWTWCYGTLLQPIMFQAVKLEALDVDSLRLLSADPYLTEYLRSLTRDVEKHGSSSTLYLQTKPRGNSEWVSSRSVWTIMRSGNQVLWECSLLWKWWYLVILFF